jgi:nucleoside-diphosphate-sugar epimerase
MKLLITGASGFLGRFVVAEALRRGHSVRVAVRPGGGQQPASGATSPEVEVARVDLRSKAGLVEACRGVDAVLHLAASKAGDMYAQYAGTVVATENLLAAMTEAGVRRIVGISSFAVYDYLHRWSYSTLDEDTPLEQEFPSRDEYSHTKLVQERLIREHARAQGWDYAILRPGVIYGRDNLWTARVGMSGNEHRWFRIGWLSRLPLSYVENCAEAILLAVEKVGPLALTVNVLDDDCPTQSRYVREVFTRLSPRPRSFTIPWTVMRALARTATICNASLWRGRAKLPAILVPARLHARFKPLRYSNAKLHTSLGWQPRYSMAEALDRSVGIP